MSNKLLKPRIEQIIAHLSNGLHERDEVIAVSLLSALAGQNTFLFGPPGTAKSLISRRISHGFEGANYFEYLMNRFSTPEEVFGAVSIKALKEDKYTRKTQGYLPTADFAFLDEIWKSSPAILNTLLTLINEHTFKNGDVTEKAPLKALISASNETPQEGQGLDALYDRFLIRMLVPPMQKKENFEELLQSKPTVAAIEIKKELQVSTNEWNEWQSNIHDVALSKETLTIISLIRIELDKRNKKDKADVIYVSDRRWQRAALLIKASAFFCDRSETNHSDTLLLRHCLWTKENNINQVYELVENAVQQCGMNTENNLSSLDKEKERLDQEITKELYYSDDIYRTETLADGIEYFKVSRDIKEYHSFRSPKSTCSFYIKNGLLKSAKEFQPVDKQGQEIKWIKCDFDNQGACALSYDIEKTGIDYDYIDWTELPSFTPDILFYKGHQRFDVNKRLISSLLESTHNLKNKIKNNLASIEDQRSVFVTALETPFVPKSTREISVTGVDEQVNDIKLRLSDCDRLVELCVRASND
ncbi:ATPase associated with various cellular activities [Psychromonas ingrahamii 37]|uniref:ATPase associated with various cellular activities n=1 Tax=Psychromonas ingrahamii (strain DSM 17664 / CCUG 51855 / 37) TaxID=357804 RepID=A1SXM1_PSYIN|nr:AAA family ATPase [Psychromonas ingrahamii]ABM04236.1 ATPase associated with various cellular activities [Psychromonas ingrahamii 37]